MPFLISSPSSYDGLDGAWYMPTPVLLTADRLFASHINTNTAAPGTQPAATTRANTTSVSARNNHESSSSSSSSSLPLCESDSSSEEQEQEQEQEEVVQVVAGWGHSALVTASGRVYMAGRNVQGQLGLGPVDRFPVNERGGGGGGDAMAPFSVFTLILTTDIQHNLLSTITLFSTHAI